MHLFNFYILYLIVGFPLISFIPLSGITIIYRAVGLIVGIVLLILAFSNKVNLINKRIFYLFFFLLIYFCKLTFDLLYTDLPFGRDNRYEIILLSISSFMLPIFIFLFYPFEKINLNRIITLMMICLYIVCIFSIVNGLIFGYSYRLSGNEILNPISLGHYAVTSIIISCYFIFFANKKKYLIFYFSVGFVGVVCLFLTASRGPLVSLIFIITLLLYASKTKLLYKLFAFMFSICSILAAYLVSITYFNSLVARFDVNLGNDGGEGEVRVFLWKLAVDKFLNSPILGSNTTTSYGYVHNMTLEILMSLGVFGIVSYLYFCIFSVRKFIFMVSIKDEKMIFGVLFIQYFVASFFSGTVYSNDLLWVFLGLSLLSASKKVKDERC